MSLTYTGILAMLLAYFLPIEQAGEVAEALVLIVTALVGLYGRYRLRDLTLFGKRKQV
jgi:hypothetical protein